MPAYFCPLGGSFLSTSRMHLQGRGCRVTRTHPPGSSFRPSSFGLFKRTWKIFSVSFPIFICLILMSRRNKVKQGSKYPSALLRVSDTLKPPKKFSVQTAQINLFCASDISISPSSSFIILSMSIVTGILSGLFSSLFLMVSWAPNLKLTFLYFP